MDCISIAHREPEDISLATLEAMLANLPESSATRRKYSPYLVDTNGFLLATLRDLTLQIAMGSKKLAPEKTMVYMITKGTEQPSAQEQMAAAEEGRALYEKKRLERIARKAELALSDGKNSPES